MIELKNITKEYLIGKDTTRILKDISLKVDDGEFVGIIGSSGSGKSTLMHIIGLLDVPTTGEVLLDGKDVSKLSDTQISRLRNQHIGFVFQQFNLIDKLTVLENILLPSTYSHQPLPYNPHTYALELLEKFGLSERKDYYPNKISGGQQQRVAITRALIMKPKIILADEPTGNLDSKTGEEILTLITELNKDFGVTVIMVTHDPHVARRTNRQIRIQDGRIKN